MQEYQIYKMSDYSNHQIDEINMLEQQCKIFDKSSLRVGIESLKEVDGDEAYLCQIEDQLIGFLSWYTSDGTEANINAMVHPEYRRYGVFQGLLKSAVSEMEIKGIQTCRFRIPSNSEAGIDCIRHMGGSYSQSQFSMTLNQILDTSLGFTSGMLRLAEELDLEFLVECHSQAFGESEFWSRKYLTHTSREPARKTYIAMDGLTLVGMIRVNFVDTKTAVIHDFCVLPALQGKGYGREILTQVVKLLLSQECSQIRLSVVTENSRALSLYQSIGFDISAESHYYVISMNKLYEDKEKDQVIN